MQFGTISCGYSARVRDDLRLSDRHFDERTRWLSGANRRIVMTRKKLGYCAISVFASWFAACAVSSDWEGTGTADEKIVGGMNAPEAEWQAVGLIIVTDAK